MSLQIRSVSLYLRRLNSTKEGVRILASFEEWRRLLLDLPPARPSAKQLLVIRLDDIGDYLLFRNQLARYKRSDRWKDHTVTLLGNTSWKDIFTSFDADAVDRTIWVDKAEYLRSAPYRWEVWRGLREQGFESVVAPSRTRPLLLDDLCHLAAAPMRAVGSVNTYVHPEWNRASDSLYAELFRISDPMIHEYHFNEQFADWICGTHEARSRPSIELRGGPPLTEPYVLCFVGANTRSKRWPTKRWVELIRLYRRHCNGEVILAGSGRAETQTAETIRAATGARSIAGTVSLPELVGWVAGAAAVVTNDTMAAHLGASARRPTLIVANGVNYERFTEYASAGIGGVVTLYPAVFERQRRRCVAGTFRYHYPDAISADIASITGRRAFGALQDLLQASSAEDLRPGA